MINNNTLSQQIFTANQRWSLAIVAVLAALMVFIALNLRQTTLNATAIYRNSEAGITAVYPRDWLLDDALDGQVFQVRDMTTRGYKTAFQVSTIAASGNTELRTIVDQLSIERSQRLTAYRVLSTAPVTLTNDVLGQQVTYSFVSIGDNPFVQDVGIVVIGVDILTPSRGQTLIITLLTDATTYDQNFRRFQQFIDQLQF